MTILITPDTARNMVAAFDQCARYAAARERASWTLGATPDAMTLASFAGIDMQIPISIHQAHKVIATAWCEAVEQCRKLGLDTEAHVQEVTERCRRACDSGRAAAELTRAPAEGGTEEPVPTTIPYVPPHRPVDAGGEG